jgi:phosphoadenosine phosphosulfate reductase
MEENLKKKVDRAIKLIQSASKIAAENGCPEIEVCYSSGKDSDVILELTKMADVPYRAIYKNTTIDPSGSIKHAQDMGAEIIRPKDSFLKLIEKNGLPTMHYRFCCRKLKEYKILDYAIVGIRREESPKRAKRYKEPEQCRVYSKKVKARQYFPILDWTKEDVAEFLEERGIRCHPLYYDEDGAFHPERRLGCLGCPLAGKIERISVFKQYPNLVKLYVRGGQKFLDSHPNSKIVSYYNDAYEWFTENLFCDNVREFQEKFGKNLFDDGIDCKKFLEDYFKIKFKD